MVPSVDEGSTTSSPTSTKLIHPLSAAGRMLTAQHSSAAMGLCDDLKGIATTILPAECWLIHVCRFPFSFGCADAGDPLSREANADAEEKTK